MTKTKKFLPAILLSSAFIAFPVFAENKNLSDLRANFRRIALEMASTEVQNAKYYTDNPNSQLSADSQTMIKGVFGFVINFRSHNNQTFFVSITDFLNYTKSLTKKRIN